MDKFSSRKIGTVLKAHGGKSYLARRIISLFPDNYTSMHYEEPCLFGGSVFFNTQDLKSATLGDLDPLKINVFQMIQRDRHALQELLRAVTYEEQTFLRAKDGLAGMVVAGQNASHPPDQNYFMMLARTFIIVNRMSRGGLGKDFAWSDRLRGGKPGDVNAWHSMIERLPDMEAKLRSVTLLNASVFDRLEQDGGDQNRLWYIDPPYEGSTRSKSARKCYGIYEWGIAEHQRLANILQSVKGKVILSGYSSYHYDLWYEGWKRTDFEIANHSSQASVKQRRIECTWKNF